MMILYQLLICFGIIAAGIHGVADCDFVGQLDDHYLEAAYLDSSGAFYIRGEKAGEIEMFNGEEGVDRIEIVDAIRIDNEKFALLGYAVHNERYPLKKLLVIEYDKGEIKTSMNNIDPEGLQFDKQEQAYYDQDKDVINIDGIYKLSLNEKKVSKINGEENPECFENDNVRCVYDPYNQTLKVVDEPSYKLLTASCGLDVVIHPNSKVFVTDGRDEDKFCLTNDAKYQKVFLFLSNSTMSNESKIYNETNCNANLIVSKTPRTTVAPYRPNQNQSHLVNAGVKDGISATCDDVHKRNMWIGAGCALGVFVLLLIAGLAMIIIERKGKGKKQAYMRLQKMLKKDEPSAYTTMTQTQTQDDGGARTQDDGGARTQDDAAKSLINNSKQQ